MFLGLRDALAAAKIDAHLSVFSYYPKRDADIAARMDNVSVHPGHPKHIIVMLPMIVLNRVLPFLVPTSWKRHIKALRDADAVLLVGGTTFADSMLYKVPWNVLAALPGYWLGRKTILLSQTMGPLENQLNRWVARWTLRRAVEVHGRGRQSERWVREIGITNSSYQPDLSFPMFVPEFDDVAERSDVVRRLRDKLAQSNRTPVGVAPNSIVYTKAKKIGKDYVAFVTHVVETIYEQGHLPVLIPHSYREDVSKIHNNDRSLCQAVLEQLPEGVDYYYVDADLSSQDLRAIIGRLHLLVASRFHSMVSSLAMGVPPITYGWGHHKYTEVLDEFNMRELYASFQELDPGEFASKRKAVNERRDELSQTIQGAYKDVKRQADDIPHVIVSALEDRQPELAPDLSRRT
jgi:polysaccharide pyruvyl transferase WcaK-like protein